MIKTIGVSMFNMCLITGVITEYKKKNGGGNQNFFNVIPGFGIFKQRNKGNIL